MAHPLQLHAYLFSLFIIITTLPPPTTSIRWVSKSLSPNETLISTLCTNPTCIKKASSDYGEMVQDLPLGVLEPSSVSDIALLVKSSYDASVPFKIAARGNGHSVRGQAMAKDGVVVEMRSLNGSSGSNGGVGIRVSWDVSLGFYADVGGEQLWIDVLRTALDHGLAPVSWTDYLYLSVGGTLSNAGISGQTFRHGPQISNVHELDVLTGKGELVTCSKTINSDLFYGVLGGLGQFGIITRARIVLDKAPNRVKWVRMIYEDFSNFTKDQEHLISILGLDYVEGFLITNSTPANNFFLPSDRSTINSLASEKGILYCLEAAKYYDDQNITTIDEELEMIFTGLSFKSGFIFKKDTTFLEFLNRVRNEELELEAIGQWNVFHPWLNLFVPRSRMMDFNQGVFVEIIQKQSKGSGVFIVYPMNRIMWDDQSSAIIPDEEVFYTVGLLHAASDLEDWSIIEEQNEEILRFCDKSGIEIKQYFPHYRKKVDWMKHFGNKWKVFQEMKDKYDPKMILSPGQGIFSSE